MEGDSNKKKKKKKIPWNFTMCKPNYQQGRAEDKHSLILGTFFLIFTENIHDYLELDLNELVSADKLSCRLQHVFRLLQTIPKYT